MSQETRILEYLELGHTLSPLQALQMMGCFRLASRIRDLRVKGYNIDSEFVKIEKKTYCKYWLKKEK